MLKITIETLILFDDDTQVVSKFKHNIRIIDTDTHQIYHIPYSPESGATLKSILGTFNGDFPNAGIALNTTSKKKLKALINQLKNQ